MLRVEPNAPPEMVQWLVSKKMDLEYSAVSLWYCSRNWSDEHYVL